MSARKTLAVLLGSGLLLGTAQLSAAPTAIHAGRHLCRVSWYRWCQYGTRYALTRRHVGGLHGRFHEGLQER